MNVPRPGVADTSPSRSSSRYAFATVFGLIAVAATTSRTVGSWSPTSSRPRRSASFTCWTICRYIGRPERWSRWNCTRRAYARRNGSDRVARMKTSLGIWAFGGMATRFNPGGYKPELSGVSTADKVRTAVAGLGDLMDDYEFHYPQELSPENLDAVRDALDGHGIYAVATGTHLNPRF